MTIKVDIYYINISYYTMPNEMCSALGTNVGCIGRRKRTIIKHAIRTLPTVAPPVRSISRSHHYTKNNNTIEDMYHVSIMEQHDHYMHDAYLAIATAQSKPAEVI